LSNEGKTLWIEVLSRNDEVVARHRVRCATPGEAVHIGRGYDNHVIIDDPYVAARHLRIVRDENGALVAEDLGSANGLVANQDRRRVERAVLDGRRSIEIGRTRLRVREADHAVEPERISRPRVRLWPLVLGLAGALLGAELLTMWLGQTTEQKPGDYLSSLLMLCLSVVVWTTAWAVMSRIFSGRARFERHLLIAICGLLALTLFNELTSYGAFAFSWRALVAYRYIFLWLLAAFVCFLHLRQLSQSREIGRSRLRLKASAAAALALLGIAMQTLSQWEASASADRQTFLRGLKPPVFRLARAQTEDGFLAEVSKLKPELDRARAEQPGRVWHYGSDED
jgi:Inner membrane component of T3SS, cytoplasmic domain